MKDFKRQMTEIMQLAWQFVKRNGFSMSEALKVAWRNFKVKNQMKQRIVKFYFQKVDGSVSVPSTGTYRISIWKRTNGGASRRQIF